MKRVRAMSPVSTRDQTVAAEHVANLRQRGVGHRQDQVARLERVGLVLRPGRAYAVEQRREGGLELLLVARLDGGLDARVEVVERRDRVVGEVVLPLTEDADDHFWSPEDSVVSGSASRISPPSAPASIASGALARLELGELGLDLGLRAHRLELAADVVTSVERAGVLERTGGDQLVDRAGPGLHLRGLVLGPLDRQADVAHLLADARHRLADLRLGLGGGVGRLDRLLAGAERLDLGAEPLLGERQLLLLALELRLLRLEVDDLLGEPGLAGQRLAGEVLAADA